MYVQTAITLFNKRLGADRREVYFPTCITGASFFESRSSSHSTDGAHSESLTYKLRIPIDAKVQDDKTYLSEMAFKALTAEEAADHWTIQKGDIVLACATELSEPVAEPALKELAKANLADVITVKEYADNTIRGFGQDHLERRSAAEDQRRAQQEAGNHRQRSAAALLSPGPLPDRSAGEIRHAGHSHRLRRGEVHRPVCTAPILRNRTDPEL